MKSSGIKFLLIVVYLPVTAFAQVDLPVEYLHLAKFRWMEERQTDSLAMLLHQDVRYIHSNGWIETKDEILQNIQDGILIYRNVSIENSTIRKSRRNAIVKGKGSFDVTLRGNELSIPLIYEEHYLKTSKGWVLIYRKSERFQPSQ
ncbi:nuclear transport factor 2 family protein [Schleiferia thermophila]|jgi:hypothetical protein|uniref:Uncharacterized protein DUF4440 n=1 Tax=Schleiferia thermophila TaxID=884107 RepID=A0A369A397_9FLAO|nr:nuclear transport factor 2 family protein [Schleiferia thermophila]PMB29347.1 DUF4440 domain-containing protein [Fischerella thermalis CCMEE 5319]RCX03790.1 uncharacterized protein DUF4440 [Schleiferia thermophila]GCD80023.1 hypothetical protein JCM30197_12700 [Schleiferia thermophila]